MESSDNEVTLSIVEWCCCDKGAHVSRRDDVVIFDGRIIGCSEWLLLINTIMKTSNNKSGQSSILLIAFMPIYDIQ